MKILLEMCLWTRNHWLNFGSDPLLWEFWNESSTLRDMAFFTFWPISLEKLIVSLWKFYHLFTFGHGSAH